MPLDWTNENNMKPFYRAIELLDQEFNADAAGLNTFLRSLKQHAWRFNWTGTVLIQTANGTKDLISDYEAITFAEVKTKAHTYAGTGNRDEQNAIQIAECVMSSLMEGAQARVYLQSNQFIIQDLKDGLLIVKLVIQMAHIDTCATVSIIRSRLSSLDAKMVKLQDNIMDFNEYVQLQQTMLKFERWTDSWLAC